MRAAAMRVGIRMGSSGGGWGQSRRYARCPVIASGRWAICGLVRRYEPARRGSTVRARAAPLGLGSAARMAPWNGPRQRALAVDGLMAAVLVAVGQLEVWL